MFSCALSVEKNLINRTKEDLKIIESLMEKEKQREKDKDLEGLLKLLEESRQLVREEKWDKALSSLNHILYMLNSRHEKWRKTALSKLSLAKNMIELRASEGKDINHILPLMKQAMDSIENQYNFQETSKYLDQVFVLLRENKPEEEKNEILPFTPDTVNRMFTRLKLLIDIKEAQGEDMDEIKKMAQKPLKLAQKRDVRGTIVALRNIFDRLEPRTELSSAARKDQTTEDQLKSLSENFSKEILLRSPTNDTYMKKAYYYWVTAKMYCDASQLDLAKKNMELAVNQIKKSSPVNVKRLIPEKYILETKNLDESLGKVLPPSNKGAYLGYWGDPHASWENSFYNVTNSHAAIIYDDASWYNFKDNYFSFDDFFDFNNTFLVRDSFDRNDKNPLITNFKTLADLYSQQKTVYALAWTPGIGGYGEYNEFFRYKKAPHMNDVINGEWDSYIIKMAHDIKKWGKPIMLELHYEFNEGTQTTGGPKAFGKDGETEFIDICNPDLVTKKILHPEEVFKLFIEDTKKSESESTNIVYDCGDLYDKYGDPKIPDGPERVRDMWRHVHDIFDQVGVTNVTWFAHSIGNYGAPFDKRAHLWNKLDYYWPGENYVDWVGVSCYYASVNRNPLEIDIQKNTSSFHTAVSWFYKALNESKWKDKPVMLVEFVYTGWGGEQETIKKIFGDYLLNEFPDIKCVIYGNQEPPGNLGAFSGEKEAWEKYVNSNPYYIQFPQFSSEHVAPGRITDFNATISQKNIILTWTAPGDDEYKETVSNYIIKYRENPIDDSGGIKKDFRKEPWTLWSKYETKDVEGEPKPEKAGSKQKMVISGFKPGTYYFGIQSVDDVPYNSPISNIVEVGVK